MRPCHASLLMLVVPCPPDHTHVGLVSSPGFGPLPYFEVDDRTTVAAFDFFIRLDQKIGRAIRYADDPQVAHLIPVDLALPCYGTNCPAPLGLSEPGSAVLTAAVVAVG